MDSKIRHLYDAATAFRAPGLAAVTSDGNSDLVDLYAITKSPYGALDGKFGLGSFDVVLFVSAIDTTSGSETYTLNFQTVDAAGANPVTQHSVTITGGLVGVPLVYAFHPATLQELDADAAQMRVNVDVGGATPSLTYYAFASPHSHQ